VALWQTYPTKSRNLSNKGCNAKQTTLIINRGFSPVGQNSQTFALAVFNGFRAALPNPSLSGLKARHVKAQAKGLGIHP